jgi:hypothetical protein
MQGEMTLKKMKQTSDEPILELACSSRHRKTERHEERHDSARGHGTADMHTGRSALVKKRTHGVNGSAIHTKSSATALACKD